MASTIPLKDAKIFFGGYEPTAQHNQVELEWWSESLDETALGDGSRKMRGGLKVTRMTAAGFNEFGNDKVDKIYFESVSLSDAVVMVAPEEITEGSTSSGFVFGFKSLLASYSPLQNQVGELQGFSVTAEGRGVGA